MIWYKDVRRKLDRKRELDLEFKAFGACKHKYHLEGPISEEKVRLIEERYSFQLPDDYRRFITEVGNGGAGPGYGLNSFNVNDNEALKWCSKPFILMADHKPDDDIDDLLDRLDAQDTKFCDSLITAFQDNIMFAGNLVLAGYGCGETRNLIVNGPCKGEVWAFDGTQNCIIRNKQSFMDWYMSWIDSSPLTSQADIVATDV